MRYFLVLILVFTFFAPSELNAQKTISPADKFISLYLPQNINTDGLEIEYFMKGDFGGIGNFVRIEPDVRRFEIPTFYEGKPADAVSLIVFSPNYQAQTFDFP